MTYERNSDPCYQGWYVIQADRLVDGETMWDGTIRFRMTSEGEISDIENTMAVCVYRGTEEILTQKEAYEQLRLGDFSDGAYFEHNAPSVLHVTSCTLTYVVDTKGYRQPVYEFDFKELGSVFVPALAG